MLIVAVVVGLVLLALVMLTLSLAQQRRDALRGAEASAANLVRAIEEQARGGMNAVDVMLALMARGLQSLPGAHEPRNREIHALLRASLENLPFVRAIWVLDTEGNMIHDTDDLPGSYNLSEREYFRVHRDAPTGGMYLEAPIRSRLGVWFVGSSRRIDSRNGDFAGVIAAGVEPRYFDQFYASLNVGEQGVVAVTGLDGTIVTRAPAGEKLRGTRLEPAPQFITLMQRSPTGTYRAKSQVDGVERIYAYRRVADRPLVVLVGMGIAESLAGWRSAVAAQTAAAAGFIAMIAWLGALVLRELMRRRRVQALLQGQKEVLELIAGGAPLATTLDRLVRVIESQAPELLASILLLDEDGRHLRLGAAPSLPEPYNRAIDGEPIGERAGSCGTAAFRRAPVVVEDIQTDPLWENYRELARQYGFRACWSTPIFDREKRLVGTFALYYGKPRGPSRLEKRLIETATSTAGVAIGRAREERALRLANERLHALSARLLQVQESERATIARELHDQLGQSLTALKLSAGALAPHLPGAQSGRMTQHLAIADRALAQVRSLALDLRPPQLDQLGLGAALRDALERFGEDTGMEAAFVDGSDGIEPEGPLATAIFRIAQEALTNVARHADAKRVLVELRAHGREIRLVVFDDGRGYDYTEARERAAGGASMGILGMEERVTLAGGRLDVVTGPHSGTRVEARFPLPAPIEHAGSE